MEHSGAVVGVKLDKSVVQQRLLNPLLGDMTLLCSTVFMIFLVFSFCRRVNKKKMDKKTVAGSGLWRLPCMTVGMWLLLMITSQTTFRHGKLISYFIQIKYLTGQICAIFFLTQYYF